MADVRRGGTVQHLYEIDVRIPVRDGVARSTRFRPATLGVALVGCQPKRLDEGDIAGYHIECE